MAVVVFDPAAFKIRYPAFANAPDATLTAIFGDTGLYLSNSDCSLVQNIARRTSLLWMITAHLAQLGGVLAVDGQAPPVGRVSQASEGSVSASLDMGSNISGSQAWWLQTPYGANYWQATQKYRSARYVAQPTDIYSNNGGPYYGPGRRRIL